MAIWAAVPPLIRQALASLGDILISPSAKPVLFFDDFTPAAFFLDVAVLRIPCVFRACSPSVIFFAPALFILKDAGRLMICIFFCLGIFAMAAIRKSVVGSSVK